MNVILGYTILILGMINAVQMCFSFIAGDIYDIKNHRTAKKFKNKKYEPFVSIAISAFNEEKCIYRTLESIYASDYKKFEVIVVNDGSKDNTSLEIMRYQKERNPDNLRLIEQQNAGKANALNNAIKNYAKGELVMCLDADSIVSPTALSRTVAHFKDDSVAATAASVRIINDGSIISMFQSIEYLFSYRLKKARSLINAEYIIGGVGSTFRKIILEECNYFDTNSLTEDIDLTIKIIRLKGNKRHKIIYAPDVICYTESVLTLKAIFKQRYRWKYGFLQSLYKNKKLIFNPSSKYSKTLTFYNLPYAVFTEILSILDPFILLFVTIYSIRYIDTSLFAGMLLFLSGYTLLTILADDYTSIKEKALMILYVPICYIFYLTLGIIGDLALFKSLFRYNGIVHAKELNKCNWNTAERSGIQAEIS